MSEMGEARLKSLKARAESVLAQKARQGSPSPGEKSIEALVHDLSVYQIELEMQNDELRQAQAKIEKILGEFQDLYHHAPVGYISLDPHGLIVRHNHTFSAMIGAKGETLLGELVFKVLHPEDSSVFLARYRSFFKSPQQKNIELRLLRRDGAPFWARLSGRNESVLGEDARSMEILLVTVADITSEKMAASEKLLLEQQFQQAQRLESLGVLAGGIAHDFNNILAVIVGHCSLARRPGHFDISTHLDQIERASGRAAELCQLMLSYAGKSHSIPSRVWMLDLTREMVSMLGATIEKNVTVRLEALREIPAIRADASQIRQIIMNLIINGAEAIGSQPGEVLVSLQTVEVEPDRPMRDHLGASIPAGSYIRLEVSDNGCGMGEETSRHIFEPFFSTKFTGRGLGMAAVLGIVTAHRGALQLETRPGQGTTFKVYLPVEPGLDKGAVAVQKPPQSDAWTGSGTILLVEDEEEVLNLAKAMLEQMGYCVLCAVDGKEALERYRQHLGQIDIVVTDLRMPVMDGYALFDGLKALNPELPIVISSGYGDARVTSRIPPKKIAGLVGKPYNFEQLREVIRRVAEAPRDPSGRAEILTPAWPSGTYDTP